MSCRLSLSTVAPVGLAVDHQEFSDGVLIVTALMRAASAVCPSCNRLSQRVHSRYYRRVADLPLSGRVVQLQLVARRFRCEGLGCRQRIFAERFGSTVPERARRIGRMEEIVHHLGLALGGRHGAVLAARLMLSVSNDTLLRFVRRRARSRNEPLAVVGVDDWAFRRNHRYGTIICDMERRRIIKLLPDREISTVAAWLAAHPGIRVVSRDRGGGYGEAGCHNGAELWLRLQVLGFGDSERVVREWATRRRRSERTTSAQLRRPPSARTIVRLMTLKRDHLTRAETLTVAAIEESVPTLAEARSLVDRFQSIVQRKAEADLDPWLRDATPSLIASFARGITKDLAAVRAAVTEPWSNGQTEGHVNRLKLVTRQMYGRAKLDLLEARLIGAP